MVFDTEAIVEYGIDESLCSDLEVIVVVKRVDQKLRDSLTAKRILESGSDPSVMRRGSSKSTTYHAGFVGRFMLSDSLGEPWVRRDTKQPTGILHRGNSFLVAAGDSIEVLDEHTMDLSYSVSDPWFARLHSISAMSSSLLVTSSAYDLLVEVDFELRPISEFCLWEHGYHVNHEGVTFARSSDTRLADMVIDPSYRQGLGVSTAMIPNHMNGALPFGESRYIASLLHRGTIVAIDPISGDIDVLIEGLSNPHLSGKTIDGRYVIADTSRDMVLVYDPRDQSRCVRYSMSGVARKKPWIVDECWLQNVTELRPNVYCAIDSPSRTLIVFDTVRKRRRNVSYDDGWAVQMVVPARG